MGGRTSQPASPRTEEAQQHGVERLGGADTEVVAVGVGADGAGLLEEPAELLEVRLADLPGVHLDALLVFQREEERRIFIGEGELGWIDQVKDGDVVLAGAEGQKPPEGVGSLVKEVREDAHQRAAREFLGEEVGGRGGIRLALGGGELELVEQHLKVRGSRPGRHLLVPPAGHQREAGAVLLPEQEVRESGGQHLGDVELGEPGGAEGHRARGVHHHRRPQVGLVLVALDVVAIELAVGLPVEVLELVAGGVLLVLGELDALALVGRLVEPGEDALDDGAGAHLDSGEARERLGVKERHEGVERSAP